MKQKIAAHLSTLTPFLRGVDFQKLEKIGPENVRAIINYLYAINKGAEDEIGKLEEELLSVKDDVMKMTEISAHIAYKRIKTGNRKLALANMKTVLGSMEEDNLTIDFPLLPTLRVNSPFEPGDDVMIYIGETGLESEEHPYDRSLFIPTYNWACAKVLSFGDYPGEYPTVAFFNNSTFKKGSLDGHFMQVLTTSPLIFGRKEFFEFRRVMSKDYSDSEFMPLFFQNCEHSPWRYKIEPWKDVEQIKKIMTDSNIEEITDEELADKEKELIEHALKVTEKHYIFVNEARNMAKARGYLKED